jgi:hypothetical protein
MPEFLPFRDLGWVVTDALVDFRQVPTFGKESFHQRTGQRAEQIHEATPWCQSEIGVAAECSGAATRRAGQREWGTGSDQGIFQASDFEFRVSPDYHS